MATATKRKRFVDDDYPADAEAYLRESGWKHVGPHETPNPKKRWLDPTTGQPAQDLQIGEEHFEDGRPSRPVMQRHVGSAPWYYSEEEAVGIQQDRDRVSNASN